MWELKTLQVIKRQRRWSRFDPRPSLLFSLLCSVPITLMIWGGYRGKFMCWDYPIPLKEVLAQFPEIFILIFALTYFFRLLGARWEQTGAMICNCCQKVQAHTKDNHCSCGGELERLENWRWVPEELN